MIRQPSALALAIDAELSTTVRGYQASEHRMAVLLARMDQGKLHQEFGYASLADYGAERLGLELRQTGRSSGSGRSCPTCRCSTGRWPKDSSGGPRSASSPRS